MIACDSKHDSTQQVISNVSEIEKPKLTYITSDSSELEKYYVSKNLINIQSLDSTIKVSLHYSTTQNFLHKVLYKNLNKCYLPCEVAIKLSNAQYYLQKQFPLYNIVVFDATRPLSIQKQLWDEFDMPAKEKINYLAHPSSISLHNYGAAVDVGIMGENNVLLDMGTPFDCFDKLSQPKFEKQFYKNGELTKQAYANRLLLRSVMTKAGFTIITSEWWHFNATNKINAAAKYELIN